MDPDRRGPVAIVQVNGSPLSESWLAGVVDARTIGEVTRLPGGASRETYRFVADGEALVLQLQRPRTDRSLVAEAELMRLVGAHGVPVPEVVTAGRDPAGGEFLVTRAIPGETIARRILRDDEFGVARSALTSQLGATLGALHTVDTSLAPMLVDAEPLSACRERADELGIANPVFELAFRWLELRRPEPRRLSVIVHGDFRLGNLIIDGDGLAAVIDWELAHLGNPMEDLGWLCSRAWRFGGPRPVAGVGGYAELFDAYRSESGAVVDLAAMRWWRVLSTLRWGVICVDQARLHLDGIVRSHELAAIGRRVSQTEHDLLVELDEVQ